MPKLTNSVPKYRKHKATGQAVVTIQGRHFYLGPHGSKASKIEYDRLIGEWLANGRPTLVSVGMDSITITELCAAFWKHAKTYYVKHGKPTGTAEGFKPVICLFDHLTVIVALLNLAPHLLRRYAIK